jgi:hypothetical protein
VIVTHNMQQAARVSDRTAFLIVELDEEEARQGRLIEFDETEKIFTTPATSVRRTTCPARSADGGAHPHPLPGGARGLERHGLGGLDLVVTALERTMEAIEHQDVELAQIVIADDDRIDGRYLEVHQALITLLATQSPVATDLRLISAPAARDQER